MRNIVALVCLAVAARGIALIKATGHIMALSVGIWPIALIGVMSCSWQKATAISCLVCRLRVNLIGGRRRRGNFTGDAGAWRHQRNAPGTYRRKPNHRRKLSCVKLTTLIFF